MTNDISNYILHLAAAFGSAVYVLLKPSKNWVQNIAKFFIGYVSALYLSSVVLSVFQYFFGFGADIFQAYLPASGFITGLCSMTAFEAFLKFLRHDTRTLLSEIVRSWFVKK